MAKVRDIDATVLAKAALACWAVSALLGVQAVRTILWFASLGPMCGSSRSSIACLHCPACPASLAFAVSGGLLMMAARPATRSRP